MPRALPQLVADFLTALKAGRSLCVMTLPRIELGLEPIEISGNCRIYPQGEINLDDLHVVSYPKQEFDRYETERKERDISRIQGGELAWYQSAATRICLSDFDKHSLIAFAVDMTAEQLLQASHNQHKELIRSAAETAERALDIVRFAECSLEYADSLPGRAGTFDLQNPYSAALFYFLLDDEAYVIAGQCVTHLIAAGIGLQIEIAPEIGHIGFGETGHLVMRALAMFTQALESNSETDKFIRAISVLEFIAGGGEYLNMRRVKTNIAVHVAKARTEYHLICNRFRELTGDTTIANRNSGFRTRIVHMGERLEDILPDHTQRRALFREIERFVRVPLQDMIRMSDEGWSSVVEFRKKRMQELGV